jgi:hypothetical protein
MLLSFGRRLYYLCIAEFRWIGSAVIVYTLFTCPPFRQRRWRVAAIVAAANLVLVSVLGGAELERYLLPTLAIYYVAVAVALTCIPKKIAIGAGAVLAAGLIGNFWWNPPYPFPYENNLAMVDFVRLQQAAAEFLESAVPDRTVATAWPYSAGLRNPDFGFVKHGLKVKETGDFHADSIRKVHPDLLVTYTRTWTPETGVIRFHVVRALLTKLYAWEPDITEDQCRELGLNPVMSWSSQGQHITVYAAGRLLRNAR